MKTVGNGIHFSSEVEFQFTRNRQLVPLERSTDYGCLHHIEPNDESPNINSGKKCGPGTAFATFDSDEVYNQFKPFLLLMKLFGLYFDGNSGSKSIVIRLQMLYCLTFLSLNWLMALGIIVHAVYFFNRMDFSKRAMVAAHICWTLQNGVNASLCFWLSRKGRLHHLLIQQWCSLTPCSELKNKVTRYSRRVQRILLCVFASLMLLDTVGFFVLGMDLLPFTTSVYLLTLDYESVYPYGDALRNFLVLGLIFFSGPTSFIVPELFILVCKNFTFLFKCYNAYLRNRIQKWIEKGEALDIGYYRLQYHKIIQTVTLADHLFGVYILTAFLSSLACVLFVIYAAMFYESPPVVKFMIFYWVLLMTILLTAISFTGFGLHVEASKVVDDLYAIPMTLCKGNQTSEVMLFIQKLNEGTVGFTGLGFFTLTKSFVLTLVSAFLTYFFLLLQFGSSVSASNNCFHMNSTSH